MKKVYIFLTAICLVALTGCIKEDVDLTQANVSMSISTRVDLSSPSVEQGDAIGDINVWAFACDASGEVSSDKAVAWRHIPNADTHTSVDVHLQFTTCDDNYDHYYKLVTVINKGEFGTVSGITSFDRNTTYSQLASAKFQATELMAKRPGNGASSTPGQMPISHWKVISLNNSNNGSTHPDCVEVSMPVYRAVAKTQLFVAKTDASTNLVIKNVTIGSSAFPKEGVLLSAAAGRTVEVENEDGTKTNIAGDLYPSNVPSWYNNIKVGTENKSNTNDDIADTTNEEQLTLTTPNSIPVLLKDNHPAENLTSYAYITSHFLYENKIGNTPWNTTNPNAGGYYMDVTYNVGSGDKTERVWLPAVVRNHDYQVRALVDAGGKLELDLTVNDWTDASEEISYEDIVTVPENGRLTWTSSPDTTTTDGVINMGSGFAQASCEFTIPTPKGGQWHAELVTVKGSDTAFTFVDGVGKSLGKTTSGLIGTKGLLRIKTTKDNSAVAGGTEVNQAELRITASVTVGGVVRTYKVTGLTGLDNVANYIFEQGI
ncbi:MAG: hypothetical protein IJ288_04080 [Alistipes sp.]|nr:hypothetical protein [Alistipes sp.]